MKWKFIILFITSMVIIPQGFSQNLDEQKEKQMEQAIESIAESDETDITNSVILDDITKITEHPVNINMASQEELENLYMLDFRQIQNCLLYTSDAADEEE